LYLGNEVQRKQKTLPFAIEEVREGYLYKRSHVDILLCLDSADTTGTRELKEEAWAKKQAPSTHFCR